MLGSKLKWVSVMSGPVKHLTAQFTAVHQRKAMGRHDLFEDYVISNQSYFIFVSGGFIDKDI